MMRYCAVFALFLMLPFSAQAAEVKLDTTLKAVTIYAGHGGRAMLTRTTQTTMQPGKHTIVFENLPASLLPDTLRIKGEGVPGTMLGALSHKRVNNADLVSAREKALNDQRESLENQRKVIEAEKKALAAKRTFLQSLKAEAVKKEKDQIADFSLNTEDWIAGADVIFTGLAETMKAELAKDEAIKTLNKQIQKIQQDLNQLRTGQKQTYEVRIPVEATRAGRLNLELSYQMPGATWRPVYDARLETASGALELTQFGAVTQRTGEDWTDIELTLSNARPHQGAVAPALHAMWLGLGHHRRMRREGNFSDISSNVGMVESMELDIARAEDVAAPLDQATAKIDNSGFTAEFIIPGLVSVPADGTEAKVLIAPFETESALEVHIKPQISSSAFLVADTVLKGETPLLPGQVSLFRDGAYVGQTHIPLIRPGKNYDLSFGVDDQIDVAYKTLKDERGESGVLIGKKKTLERHTITEIQNLRGQDVKLVVLQTIPVSKDENITITVHEEHTTPGYLPDEDNIKGLTAWRFDLPPQAKKNIKLGWTVAWPEDQNLSGLR